LADLLKKSEIAKVEISCENTEQQAAADSHIPGRVAEGACYCERPWGPSHLLPRRPHPRPAEFWSSAKTDFFNKICH